jgi:hypothetical protein
MGFLSIIYFCMSFTPTISEQISAGPASIFTNYIVIICHKKTGHLTASNAVHVFKNIVTSIILPNYL